MADVYQLDKEDHEDLREAWVKTQLAHTGMYYPQGDAARAFRDFSKLIEHLCEKYDLDSSEEYDIDVDRGLFRVEL